VGLGAGALACWFYTRSKRQRKKKSGQRLGGTSLGEEIDAALALEAETLDVDVDLDELKAEFEAATMWVGENGGGLSNEALLAVYGCYKQALKGDAPPDRPWGIEASAKWDAWARLKGTSCANAMLTYVAALKASVPTWSPEHRGEATPSSSTKAAAGAFGMAVSTMGQLGGEDDDDDVDETPVGKLNEMIHNRDVIAALKILRKSPSLAFKPDKDGMTPMHWAADSDAGDVMRFLVELLGKDLLIATAKSPANMRDSDGNTPLHFAVMSENEEMARLLVEAGADPEAENEEGEKPSELATGEEWASILRPAKC
jgi:acyl-CoA-binding protein